MYSRDFDGTLSDMELLGVLSTKTVKIPNKKRSGNNKLMIKKIYKMLKYNKIKRATTIALPIIKPLM